MSTNTVEHRTQHTPGPWEATNMDGRIFPSVFIGPMLKYSDDSGEFRAHICINEGPTAEQVALGKGFGTTMATCHANARLIAAAPELLEAARFLFGAIESGELVRDISRDAKADWGQRMMHFTVNLGKAQAAIMKATQE